MAEIKADLKQMKGISAKDQAMLAEAETLLGPDPDEMGFVQNMFWGRLREELVFPYPVSDADETARCDQLIAALDEYLRTEHPSIQIDQEQEIPDWVLRKLFDLGVMGMTIPRELGGLGMGVTSYVRALEKLGEYCGSTAVLVSAHQSIGCKAIMLFGNEEQKQRWLPHLAKDWVSAFCLSEPNVGCDAGGQETRCELSEDGEYYILNGEKKWATSGALSNRALNSSSELRSSVSAWRKGVTSVITVITAGSPVMSVIGALRTWRALRSPSPRVYSSSRLVGRPFDST